MARVGFHDGVSSFPSSEFPASTTRFIAGRRLRLDTLSGSGISLCIECLRLLLRLDFLELTDLVMNTVEEGVGGRGEFGGEKSDNRICPEGFL